MKTSSNSSNSLRGGRIGIARRGRPPKHKKKAQPVSVEDDVPKGSSTAELSRGIIQADYRCDFCQQSSLCNRIGVFELLLFCKDCTAKAHPSCMDYSSELSVRARMGSWQCMECKTCCICLDAGNPDLMLFCDGCDKGYHMNCHIPQITDKPSGKWVCEECTTDGVDVDNLEKREQHRPTEQGNVETVVAKIQKAGSDEFPTQYNAVTMKTEKTSRSPSPANPVNGRNSLHTHVSDQYSDDPGTDRRQPQPTEPHFTSSSSSYPDAAEWSIDDVAGFFISTGYLDQAELFRDQEIDGKSLLLMKRSDVLTGMSIKLGPALKIHRIVQRLQLSGMGSARDFSWQP